VKAKDTKCRLCGKNVFEIGGFLHRVNELGGEGVWECRPSCSSRMPDDDKVIAALEWKDKEESNG